ncbi:PREDICTED: uncharacterized protein LOC109213235 [Nicotiana attenuata]|uniref:uncharacterized protein LOC109213235 n=1 Tax=Nicotiana attenuata TaxID=49451 RepID=UPI000904EE49|nr:PREDICTED: uncharacterized protein LOC109213235 [Nicotiana attenuata]
MVTARSIIAVAASKGWTGYQMDVYITFMQEYLYEEVYMEMPQGSNEQFIQETKDVLNKKFEVKHLGELRYFFGIEVMRSSKGILLYQRKYALQLISDLGPGSTKPVATPIDMNQKFTSSEFNEYVGVSRDDLMKDAGAYQMFIGRLIYLTITSSYITFVVHTLSQFMQSPKQSHWVATVKIVRYIKQSPGMGILLSKCAPSWSRVRPRTCGSAIALAAHSMQSKCTDVSFARDLRLAMKVTIFRLTILLARTSRISYWWALSLFFNLYDISVTKLTVTPHVDSAIQLVFSVTCS